MASKSEIESCLEQIRDLENAFQAAFGKLNVLKQSIQAIVDLQDKGDGLIVPLRTEISEKKEKELASPVFLGDRIIKTVYTDLKKSLSLNDRFRFQKDLFENNAVLMDKTLDDLNNLSSLPEMLDYLKNHFSWEWGNESVMAFKEILEKRFA
jgi:hypothetical protein